jgi:3,4-dihydroxy 2-butanone 4-phosphate synthase / GTP cyclohydrolase II|uniref:3,4-dihydroxy-2-butanone-4-phosphate synthase n=1 Tax=Candidatus Planktophila sp. TaxID=2175601 RepID=UPI004049C31B
MSNLQKVLDAYKNGDLIIVTDDANREDEGDLMVLAEKATPEKVAFMVRHTTGILCVAMTAERARTFRLPLMVEENQDSKKTAFTVSVDYKVGLTTGVSATERSNTVRALAETAVTHADFIRPGHIFPLIADAGGLQARGGHTEAGVALSHLVGAQPVCLLSEIVNEDGSMARGASLTAFAQQHSIPMISVEELKGIAAPPPTAQSSFEFAWAQLPLRTGLWSIATYPGLRQREHAVIAFGDAGKAPMIRIHSECFTGDVVHSQRCDCGEQLEKSISLIQSHGHGYIIYLRDHEGRGIGLTEKIKAYQLQDAGMDTIDANLHLGHEIDARDWSDAVAIVTALGVKKVTLLTNNPNKVQALRTAGVEVTQANLTVAPNTFNEKYLATKEEKLGHLRGGK